MLGTKLGCVLRLEVEVTEEDPFLSWVLTDKHGFIGYLWFTCHWLFPEILLNLILKSTPSRDDGKTETSRRESLVQRYMLLRRSTAIQTLEVFSGKWGQKATADMTTMSTILCELYMLIHFSLIQQIFIEHSC